MVQLVAEPGDSLGGQLGGHVPVEGTGDAALLRVAQHIVPDGEVAPALLRVHPLCGNINLMRALNGVNLLMKSML